MAIRIKRIYEKSEMVDGRRILVDRLWPRGISKDKAKIDLWVKELAPSSELRKWYGHEPEKWAEFNTRYVAELASKQDQIDDLIRELQAGDVTFLYSSAEQRLNNAFALKEYIESIIGTKGTSPINSLHCRNRTAFLALGVLDHDHLVGPAAYSTLSRWYLSLILQTPLGID